MTASPHVLLKKSVSKNQWFIFMPSKQNFQMRLFCFPYAGGGSTAYFPWVKHPAMENIQIVSLCLPGREIRFDETPATDMSQLVDHLHREIFPYLDKPFAFFGHSLGSRIAFQLSQQIANQGIVKPTHLFVSACKAPHFQGAKLIDHTLPNDAFIDEILRFGGIPSDILKHPEMRSIIFPILRADVELYNSFQFISDDPCDFPITAFGGDQDLHISPQDMKEWQRHTHCEFEMHPLKGGHFFINDCRNALLEIVASKLVDFTNNVADFSGANLGAVKPGLSLQGG